MQYIVKNGDKFIYEDTVQPIIDAYHNGIEYFMVNNSWVTITGVLKTDDETIINIEVAR